MVKTKYTSTEISEIVRGLLAALAGSNVTVDKVILYGSYAAGRQRDHSDIDIAIISPSFKGKKKLEIQEVLGKALAKYLAVVEPVGYSSEDYETAEAESLLGEIKRSGRILYAA
jgi:predicted nucleotidyltransferase